MIAESLLATQFGKTGGGSGAQSANFICKPEVHLTLKAFIEEVKHDFAMPDLELPIEDYDNTHAFTDRVKKRRTRSASTNRKRKQSRNSSKVKSQKSQYFDDPPMDVEEEPRRTRPPRKARSKNAKRSTTAHSGTR